MNSEYCTQFLNRSRIRKCRVNHCIVLKRTEGEVLQLKKGLDCTSVWDPGRSHWRKVVECPRVVWQVGSVNIFHVEYGIEPLSSAMTELALDALYF